MKNESPVDHQKIDQLACQALQGNAEAFGELWETVSPLVFPYLKRLGVDDAEDALSNAWVDFNLGKARYDQSQPFFPWFRRIALNKLYSLKRVHRHVERTAEALDELPNFKMPAPDPFDLAEWHVKIADCWSRLKDEDRERICLRFPEAPQVFLTALSQVETEHIRELMAGSRSCDEIAAKTGATAKVVQGRTWRAVNRFCECLKISLPKAGE